MNVIDFVIVATSSIALVLGAFIYWGDQKIDQARQRLFYHRNAVFRLAAEGKIEFTDPAYIKVRQSLNGMIRFAHRMYLLDMVYAIQVFKDDDDDLASKAIANVKDANLRAELTRHLHGGVVAILYLMVFRSILWSIVFYVVKQTPALKAKSAGVRRRAVGIVRHEAMLEGAKTLQAVAA